MLLWEYTWTMSGPEVGPEGGWPGLVCEGQDRMLHTFWQSRTLQTTSWQARFSQYACRVLPLAFARQAPKKSVERGGGARVPAAAWPGG